MSLKITIETAEELREEFRKFGRDYYSYEAYEAILEYYNSLGEDCELDVIGICGDFNEYTFEKFIRREDIDIEEEDDIEEVIKNYIEGDYDYIFLTSTVLIIEN